LEISGVKDQQTETSLRASK